jgi:dihydrofolate synthase/folylpolyglutamate synthase
VAVVEVGLGGRLDATNALEPEVSVITPISYDHTAILGRTLGAIATEKAGIMRPGRLALIAQQRPAALRALLRAGRGVGALVRVVPVLDHPVPQRGEHQRQNAALAIAAARSVFASLSEEEVELGLRRLRLPGRFEVVEGVVLDGAHNDASAAALARALVEFARGRPVNLVLGLNRDKDARAVLRPLLPLGYRVWATQAAESARALPAAELARRCLALGTVAEATDQLGEALRAARAEEGVVCVTGSLALVGQARTLLGAPPAEGLWDQGSQAVPP